MNKSKRLGRMALCLIVSFVMIMTLIPRLPAGMAFAAQGDTPLHNKGLTNNGDGTYKLSLDVKGETETYVNKVNVLVILDTSTSMNTSAGGGATRISAAKNAINSLARALLGVNGQGENPSDTVEMALLRFGTHASVVQQPTSSQNAFTSAVNGITIGQNQGTNWEEAFQTADDINFDDDRTFVIFVSDGNPTFRLTRGNYNPMDNYYYNTYNVYGNGSDSQTVGGITAATTIARCYEHAVDDATALANKYGADNFYTIGAYGSVDRMRQLTTAAGAPANHYFSAANTADLEAALASILADIQKAGFGSVSINDPTTSNVTTSAGISHLLTVDDSSFKYYRNGVEWTTSDDPAPPPARLDDDGNVIWDLSSLGLLDNDVVYEVRFDAWPSQYTYDLIADLKNGKVQYDSLDPEVQKYLKKTGDEYTLLTNKSGEDSPTISWDDTRDEAGVQTDTFVNPDPVVTTAEEMDVTKVWFNDLDDKAKEEYPNGFDMDVICDNKVVDNVTVAPDNWADSIYISTGLMRVQRNAAGEITGVQVLEEGHDYSLKEPANLAYHWELVIEDIHPMLINGVLYSMVRVLDADIPSGMSEDDDFYVIGDEELFRIGDHVYKVKSQGNKAAVSAYNERKANLNLMKTVTGNADAAPDDAEFEYTITVNNSHASEGSASDLDSDYWLWFSVYDTINKTTVSGDDLTVSGTGLEDPNAEGYYHIPSGNTITVNLQDGWNLRFTNLPTGSTYVIEESSDMEPGFVFDSIEDTTTFQVAELPDGAVAIGNDQYSYDGVIYTKSGDKYQATYTAPVTDMKVEGKIVSPNASYQVTYNNEYTPTKITPQVTKEVTGGDASEAFTFSIEAGDDATAQAIEDKEIIMPSPTTVTTGTGMKDGDTKTLDFGDITFNVAGEYTFTVKETNESAPAGWTYANKAADAKTITVVVAPGEDGKLAATVTGNNPTFTNSYDETTAAPQVTKKVEGKAATEAFTFSIELDEGIAGNVKMPQTTTVSTTATMAADATETLTFEDITFMAEGTYKFKVKETNANAPAGWTYANGEDDAKIITVNVTKNNDGKLVAAIVDDNPTFINKYEASGTATLEASKKLEGREWLDDEEYTFTLSAVTEGAPMPETGTTVTFKKDGDASFGAITYSLADAGKTYEYSITENTPLPAGVTSSGPIKATVAVRDKGDGTLETTVTYDPESKTIINTYEANGEATIKAIKALEGRDWLEDEEYTFTLTAKTPGAPMPAEAGRTVTFDADGEKSFGAIEYDESDAGKTYQYTISETSTLPDGITKSADITATVVVTDKGNGELETTITYDPTSDTITNTYEAEGEAVLKAKKALVGRDWQEDEEYTFTLTAKTQGAPMPAEAGRTVTFDADGEKSFGAIEYDESDAGKTYQYTISETSTLPDGITKSADITATVVVTDNGDGTLKTEVTYDPTSDTITNTYDATGSVEIKATKELVGRDWLDGETFTFTLKDSKGATIESKDVSEANPIAEFTAINYTEEDAGKTFTYTIDETSTLPGGIAKSSAITVTVEVADNGDGTLTATATYKNADDETTDVITNTYTAEGSVELEATKELVGREWKEGETYTFTLKDAEGNVIDEQEVSSNTTVTFDEIEYTEADMVDDEGNYVTEKTFTYTIEETTELPDGVTNNGTIEVTVTVTDNGDGTLTAVAEYTNDDTIINTYVAEGDAVLKAKKALVGRAWQSNEKYTFTLTAKTEGAPMPEEGTTVDFTADGEKSFGTITYSEEDAGKTYQYTISETSTLPDGIAKSGDITATVKVTDNGDGTLKTEVSYDPTTDTITNTYTSSGKAELKAKKSLVGRDWLDGESYTFTLYDEDGTTVYDTKTFTSNTEATFKAFEYDQDDMKDAQGNYVTTKTLTYKISETSELPEGISKSGDITATVVLTDDGKGKITAEITYSPESDTIVNTYNASGSVDIEVKKALEGRDWIEGETYTFTLYDAEGTKIEDKTVSEDNLVAAFSTINYTEEDAGKTFTYTVKETSTLPGGISNSGDITVTVEVADNGDGTLTATATYTDAEKEENDTITNKYDSEGEVELEAIKDLEGREWQEGETYTFTLKDAEGNVIDEQTVNSNSKVTFDAIEYTEEDMVDDEGNYVTEKTYTYTIEETTTLPDGMTNSGVITATVVVTDDGEGNITAEVTYDKDDTIVNTYESKGEATLKAKKALVGRAWLENEKYTFTLTPVDGAPMPKEGTTVDFTADGEKSFGTIKYTQEDMKGEDGKFLTEKTYKYTISETSTLPSGIEKSGDITATVVLKDDGNGNITATVTYDPDSDTIINTYTAEGSATLKAKKLLKGRDWMDSESYTFTLKDPNGTVVEEKTVTADGEITFAAINYDESDAGKTYTYTITETGNSSANVTASDPIQAKVEVIDNGDGTLKTNVTYTPEDDTIINTYVPTPVNAQINVNKTIDGYVSSDKGSSDNVFEFTLYDKDGKQVGDKITITTKEGTGTASFAPIQYTEVGEYTYTVKETLGSAAGYTYSTIEYPVVVTVTDDPVNGKLDASVSYGDYTVTSGDETLLDVINEFDMTDVDVTLTLTKTIDDQSNSAPDGTFTFKLYKDSVSEENFVEEKTITTKGLTGSVDFSKLTFDKSGEYTYVVVEEAGDVNGFTYDTTEHTYKIIIDDNFDAAILEVNKDSTLEAEITNIYKAKETSNILKVKKEINDTSGSAYETTFTFTLKDADGNKIDEVTVVGAEEGEFKAIEYDKAGAYEYTITEVAGDDKGYQYDTTEYKVTVTVEDKNGELVATSAYIDKTGESQTSLTVTNTYDPEDAKIVIQAEKKVDDKTGGAAGNPKTFTFELLDADGNVIETVSRVGGGTVTFSELTYSKVGEYNYTVREVAGDDKGYTYDTSEYPVTVTVTDPDKDGILKAAITVGDSVEFINPYEAEPTSAKIQVNKALAGRDLVEGEFTFKLEELVDGEAVEVGTATNTAKGKVTFDKIEYTMPGEYTYVVSEVVPEDTKGVLFDEGTIKVVVKVTDDGNGQLAAEVQYPDDKTFNNQYEPEGTYTPEVKKVLKGRDLKKNEFTFKMVGPDGKVYTAKNDADGNVVFDDLEFGVDDIGETYTYTITEKKGDLKYVKYDDHEVTLTLTITDNGDGTLKIKADYDGNKTFTNKYKKPTPPKTGDTTQVLPYMLMFTAALLGLILVFRRRKAVRK